MQRKIDDELLAVSAAPTEAPTMARAVGSRTAWRSRGAAIGVIALALSLAACGGSSNNDDPADQPIVTDPDPVNPDPVNPDPVKPDPVNPDPVNPPQPADPKPAGFTKTGDILTVAGSTDVGDRFTSDVDAQRVISYDPVAKKYYEFVKVAPAVITWPDARAAAVVKGGDLAVLATPAAMLFVNRAYDDLGGAEGEDGTWVGASQATGTTSGKGDGWTWIDSTPLAGDSELWNLSAAYGQLPLDSDPAAGETGKAQYGAIYNGLNADDTKLLYDHGALNTGTNPKYLIEYANKEAIK